MNQLTNLTVVRMGILYTLRLWKVAYTRVRSVPGMVPVQALTDTTDSLSLGHTRTSGLDDLELTVSTTLSVLDLTYPNLIITLLCIICWHMLARRIILMTGA